MDFTEISVHDCTLMISNQGTNLSVELDVCLYPTLHPVISYKHSNYFTS